jgi:alpha-ketoglutaric semialdehyde dehydrogenase
MNMKRQDERQDAIAELLAHEEGANFVYGRLQATAGESEESSDPATGERIGFAALATTEEVDAAVDAAAEAFAGWRAVPPPKRGDLLRRWAAAIEANRDELARLMTREMGKPLAESEAEIGRALGEIDYAASEGTRLHGVTIPSARPGVLVYTRPEPVGVVGAITPWNFPLIAPVRKLAPALVCGTTVVLKPARETPFVALALAMLLTEAGVPDGVVNVVCGSGSTVGDRLITHPGVAAVSFTGSTSVGQHVGKVVGQRLGSMQLELGGKNAAYVHSADDLDSVTAQITSAAIQATGQRCTAISRVLADAKVADSLVERLANQFDGLTIGRGTDQGVDVGPLVNARQRTSVLEYIDTGISEGARTVTKRDGELPEGPYVAPVVFDEVTRDMRIAREEIFGPVLSVLRVDGVEDAIETANDCEYGLTSSVFSNDLDVALRFVDGVQAGMVHVNHGTNSEPHVPFGGVESSGVGPYSVGYTVKDFFTRVKVAYIKTGVS